ncbi:hypothetical protein C8F04DRAFT_1366293 [Mycena alexandri]|uniref:Uncharacterized protein n=1 Tax=Mycena alexandri TaxID=1745969 RepID=A0AAD6XD20_9AGAR|nr:hypothetical protein C8F04DRAFT_1366293 [Mycena alexandri]
MGLRSGTKHTVATPPPAESSSEGNAGMDARTSTPADRGTLGHSANEPRPSSQDDAAEFERRSRTADVDERSTVMSVQHDSVSHSPVSQDGRAMSDDPAYRAEGTTNQDANSTVGSGFESPKKTSRASSAWGSSPVLDTKPLFFGDWFNPQEGEAPTGTAPKVEAQSWADFTDDDGFGAIPSDWLKDVKVEPVSPELPPTPSVQSMLSVDDVDDFSLDGLMNEVNGRMSSEAQHLLARRAAKMKNMKFKPATSISESTSRKMSKASDGVSINSVNLNEYVPVHSTASRSSRAAASTPRIPAAAKGKGRAPPEETDISEEIAKETSPGEETEDDRERQIKMDALLAMYMMRKLEREEGTPEPEIPEIKASGSGAQGTTEAPENNGKPKSKANVAQENMDRIIAQKLQALYNEQERRSRELETLKLKYEALKSKNAEMKHRKFKPENTPTPMDQIPRDSNLYRGMQQDEPGPGDSDSSSTSSEEDRRRKSRKSSKRKSKKARAPAPMDLTIRTGDL